MLILNLQVWVGMGSNKGSLCIQQLGLSSAGTTPPISMKIKDNQIWFELGESFPQSIFSLIWATGNLRNLRRKIWPTQVHAPNKYWTLKELSITHSNNVCSKTTPWKYDVLSVYPTQGNNFQRITLGVRRKWAIVEQLPADWAVIHKMVNYRHRGTCPVTIS